MNDNEKSGSDTKEYQALYRTWRPKTFEEVLGQNAVIRTLRNQVENHKIAHAYLFCGCRGTGKTTLAKIMSRAVNCESPIHGDPCCKCASCQAIMKEMTMDVIEMDAASNSRVEEMRDLLDQVIYPPQMCKYKVYIIDEVHMLSASAFNALLKTLEEPPEHVVFILATTEPQKIPATILSRVQRFDFGRIPTNLMIERMEMALTQMGLTAEHEALEMIARSAEGAMRDAFSILDMCVSTAENGVVTAKGVMDLLGTSEKSFLFQFFDYISQRDRGGAIRMIDELMRSGKDPLNFLKEMSQHCRCLLTVKSVQDPVCDILSITPEEEKNYRAKSEGLSVGRLLYMLDLFMSTEGTMRYSAVPRILLESVVLKACEYREAQPGENGGDAYSGRIAALEDELSALRKMLQQTGERQVPPAAHPSQEEAASKENAKKQASAAKEEPGDLPAKDAAEIWKNCCNIFKVEKPGMIAIVHDAFTVQLRDDKLVLKLRPDKTAPKLYFENPKNRDFVAETVKKVSGKETVFELSLTESSSAPTDVDRDRIEADLIRQLGRDVVQTI